ncbi:xanthine dehydrogenase accessory protein XdhC [Phaeobacter sp. B1627]|uniref:xanthine dehydrogenase accessory protein XdhC n=1 Tax=Phaeobacter sp. B1627 TaxID=2583809 RepID=UPI001117E5BD|nr:xanthine dehydrogenase accessory protein XdhC [Phaeobacter sp. B1627]TNJ47824.1 xanthine dehydrogenase accessory protein XdhC [Phaeobacter sp. B1627]
MAFDVSALRAAVAAHARVARVVVAEVRGSSPREVGAVMLVWQGGQSGTIGGGALEFQAAEAARRQQSPRSLTAHALGPDLGQCCGGAVTLLTEIFTAAELEGLDADVIARPVVADPGPQPLSVSRLLATARAQGQRPGPQLVAGWMVEPVRQPRHPLWIWGAGHVGRAMVDVLAPLPDFEITWIDVAEDRFPESIAAGVTHIPAQTPERLVAHAPREAHHLILTYSHQLDLTLCHRLLEHGFGFAGLIGSKTKWARFRSRLAALGHGRGEIDRLTCPIGRPELGKHPQAIAIGVAADLMAPGRRMELKKEHRA